MATSRDSMKSTWRTDTSIWNLSHYTLDFFKTHPDDPSRPAPKHQKTDRVPVLPDYEMQKWVIAHSFTPVLLHQLYVWLTGRNLSPLVATVFYALSFKLIAIHEMNILRELGHKYGYFDGDKHERDQIPDHSVTRTLMSLLQTGTYRPLMAVMLTYRTGNTPMQANWIWLPLEIGLYCIILDFWFYWYHRLMHQVEGLWKFHRTHHLTKHPNPLLTLYADAEQEFWDIIGIPFLTWGTMKIIGLPMGFYEWWICYQYVMFSELAGHSGVRIVAVTPSTVSWLLRLTGTELVIEDHDLHHRQGWKVSGNYGKQTRLWDTIFGTCKKRIECGDDNIDHSTIVRLPLWGPV